MKPGMRKDQQCQKWTYYKSCAEAKMKREAGSVNVANAIWAIGLPCVQLFSSATEQRQDASLSDQDLEAIPVAIRMCWYGWIVSPL